MSRPVVLIGAGRSGTKFLRDTLASSEACSVIPFDVNYVWRYGNEHFPHDAIPAERSTPEIRRYVRTTLERMARRRGAPERPWLIEKTVSNSLRVAFVDRSLPDALFIHLVRDGREVVESAARMWSERPESGYLLAKLRYFPLSNWRYGFWFAGNLVRGALGHRRGQRVWGPRYPGIDDDVATRSLVEVCARQWSACVDASLDDLEHIDPARRLTVRYEDLVADESALRSICDALELHDTDAVAAHFRTTLRKDTRAKWVRDMDSEDVDAALAILRPTLERLEYL